MTNTVQILRKRALSIPEVNALKTTPPPRPAPERNLPAAGPECAATKRCVTSLYPRQIEKDTVRADGDSPVVD
jgi:hypothetical protein